MVFHIAYARLTRAIGAAVERIIRLDAVPDDLALAVAAHRREFVNRTFEAVKRMTLARRNDFKGQVVIIATYFARCHCYSPLLLSLLLIQSSRF